MKQHKKSLWTDISGMHCGDIPACYWPILALLGARTGPRRMHHVPYLVLGGHAGFQQYLQTLRGRLALLATAPARSAPLHVAQRHELDRCCLMMQSMMLCASW